MRPIRLEISGLNSYVEKQVVDFSELTSRGLFGIFGKTGSGKSTILDAITIAMYGNISRNTNEYINASCERASIKYEFELGSKNNKKRYEVIRVFKKNSGSANSYSAILSEIHPDGKKEVIAEKKTQVDKAIVNIVGLTSSDFTRSVVLPQGKFSEFLQLEDSKRREMLERIFNLEKYGKVLTDKVKARTTDKVSKIRILESNISQYSGTSQEIFDDTYKLLVDLQEATREKKRDLESCQTRYDECKELMSYQQALEEKENKKKKLDESSEKIQENKSIVERSGYAKIVNPYIENVEESERTISSYNLKVGQLDRDYTSSNREYESTKVKYDEAQKEKDNRLEELISNKQKFERAINLKINLDKLIDEIEKINKDIQNLEKNKASMHKKKADLEECEARISRNIKENQSSIDELKYSEDFKAKVNEAFENEKELNRLKVDLENNKSNYLEIKKALDNLNSNFIFIEKSAKEFRDRLKNLNEDYTILLSKCPITRDELIIKANEATILKNKVETTRQNEIKLSELQEKFNREKEEYHRIERETDSIKKKLESIKKEMNRLKSSLEEEKILNLANDLKAELKENCPCPVCGSHHHPNADIVHNSEKIENIKSDIARKELELESETENYDSKIRKQSQLEGTIALTEKSINEIKSQIDYSSIELENKLNQSVREIKNLRENLEDWEQRKASLEEKIKITEADKNKKEKEEIEISTEISNKKENIFVIKENIEKLDKKYSELNKEYMYMKSSLKIENLKEKVDEINKNSRIIEEKESKNKKLREDKEQIEKELKVCVDNYMELDKNISDINNQKEIKTYEKRESEDEFNLITKGQNPKVLLDNTNYEIDRITSAVEKFREAVNLQKDRTENLKSELIQIKGKLEEASKKYKSSNEQLNNLLFEYKFNSIYDVKNSLVDEVERERLKDQIDFFEKEEKTLSLEIANLKEKLNNRSVNLSEYLELEKKKYRLEDEIEKDNKEIGAKQNEIKILGENLKKLNILQKDLDESNHQLALLNEIEKLLKGKKFVEFVAKNQLEYIVMEASKRLEQMTKGRYVLEIDQNLNFIMRDNYNGGLRRGIKTLSGGETFLTSLSLALALSSQIQLKGSAPLEFFFLDEGFGSLDTELLDVVMESLEKLHSEELSVGIISHVEELKNRVPVKLVVTANDGANGSKVNIEYS